MNVSDPKNQLLSRRLVAMILIVSASLLATGCDKDESSILPAIPSQSVSKESPVQEIPEQLLVIDHHANWTGEPDYKVTLFDNGSVVFQGHANVAFRGDHVSRIDLQSVNFIRNMFLSANFFSLPTIDPNWKMPYVETTFTDGDKTATVRDFNSGSPQIIVQIRTKAEELMKISELIERSPKPAIPVAND